MSQWISLIELVGSLAGTATAAFTLVTAVTEARHTRAERPIRDDSRQDGE
ncbi:hypothetical protein [Streptomyces sp. NPDC053755]